MNLTLEMFEKLGGKLGVDFLLEVDPYEKDATFELSGTGHRYLRTRDRFPDLPAMLVAYEVDPRARVVTIKGAERAWEDDLVPPL